MLQLALLLTLTSVVAATVPLWPLPSSYQLGSTAYTVHGGFQFKVESATNDVIDNAMIRYLKLFRVPLKSVGEISLCNLSVDDSTIPEIIGADESYTLEVTDKGTCSISAKNTWGLLRGMETFSQLLSRNLEEKNLIFQFAPAKIQDSPRYEHRGLLIDTARHYLSITEIKRMVESLPISK
jgi:hexosaminidase